MRRASITEAKNRLSALLAEVKGGETILVVDRGIPVARIEPVPSEWSSDGRIERLQRSGALRPPRRKPPLDIIRKPPPPLPPGVSLVDYVIEERRTGR
jgi:prevent-host-death family protein